MLYCLVIQGGNRIFVILKTFLSMKYLTVLLLILASFVSYAQGVDIRGIIYDKSNGEPVSFEKIKLFNSEGSLVGGANTDVNGLYSITRVSPGEYKIVIEIYEFEKLEKPVTVVKTNGVMEMNLYLEKIQNRTQIEDVQINAEKQRNSTQVQVSKISMDKATIERIPSIGGEPDIATALSVTPGVVTTGDQGGQMYVRGGTPIQNRILLDGMTIYSPFHSIGFFSVFETELVKNMDVYTGGFDARYGGRISSIMDITYRDGNRQKLSGKVSLSPFLGKAVLEGPLGKKKADGQPRAGSFILSAKHSMLNYTTKGLYKNVNNGTGMPYNFTDLYGKITFSGDGGTKFSAFAFHNRDSVNYGLADLDWKATGGGINFLLVPSSSKTVIKGKLTGSHYATAFQEVGAAKRYSSIGGFDLGFDFSYFLKGQSELTYGINIGGFSTDYYTFNTLNRKIQNRNFSTEVGAFVSYKLIKGRWVVQPSFRLQSYPSSSAISAEPRLGMKYNATENIRIKMSGGRFSQNFTSASSDKDVVNLFNGMLSAPDNVQSSFTNQQGKMRDVRNGLQYAWHAILGAEFDIAKNLSLNVEGFYKYYDQLSNINVNKVYDDIPAFADMPDELKKDFLIESAQAYGVDFLVRYNLDRFHVWGVYSLMKTNRWDGYNSYFPVFDRRHNVNLVLAYQFGKKKNTEVDVRWNYGSGLPYTPTSGYYQNEDFQGGVNTDYQNTNPDYVSFSLGEFNSKRLPDYHRLDITVKHRFQLKKDMLLEVFASVTNAYNRKNIFYVSRVTNEVIYQLPILPSLGVSFKF